MIATRQECLTADEVKDLLAGRLPTERFAQAIAHVDACQACADFATASEPTNCAILERSSSERPVNRYQQEPECQALMGQLLLQPDTRFQTRDNPHVPIENLGPYRLVKWLGSGGMGAVYLAEHQRLKRLSAIKLLPRDKLLHADWLERFNREMTSIAALEHTHVVRAIDAGDQDGWHYLVMEYLDGVDLSQVCRCVGQLPVGTACELVRQAALGLAAVHDLGMTHRDIKPSNMFLTRQGIVKLLDLGLVLSGDSPLAADERLTTVGHLMGTLPYMAREQLLDASDVDWRADIYSLGATLFRMLTGCAPLGSAKNIAIAIQAITTTDCPAIESLLPDIPQALAELINRMLSHDRQQRPQTASVAEQLATFSDAGALQPLVRTTLSQLARHSESRGSAVINLTQSGMQPTGSAAKPPSGRALWIASAFLPIAFLAGILITVATDRGTLVIESEEPGVTVKVTQGGKTVDTLKVENQSGMLRLSSGKYVVELVGADGDGFVLSDSQVTVLRGQKELIRVKKQSTELQQRLGSGKSYQGKSFAHWMDILQRETDVATMAQGMQGVALLAESEAEKLAAARRVLEPARQLGGYILTGRPRNGYTPDASGWYMTELIDQYHSFLPEPGLEAIIGELDTGTVRSTQACLMLLEQYGHRIFGLSLGPNHEINLSEHLQALTQTEAGSRQLKRLLSCLIKVSGQLKDEKWGASVAIRLAVVVARLLNEDLTSHREFVPWAEARLEEAKVLLPQTLHKNAASSSLARRSPLDAVTALCISQIFKDNFSQPLLLGLLESPYPPNAGIEKQLTIAFERVATQHPQETAAVIELHFERIVLFGDNIIQDRFRQPDATADRVRIATKVLLEYVKDRQKLGDTLSKAMRHQSPQSIFSHVDMDALMRKL